MATLLLLAGIVGKVASGDTAAPALDAGALLPPRSPADGLLAAGVVVLAATPFVRVLALAGVWVRVRDWRFVATAGVVLCLLVTATLLGGG
jgi:hypothetical protein